MRENISQDFEHLLFDLLLPNCKPILIGILYRPPKQTDFLEKVSAAIAEFDNFDNQEVYILGDLNYDLLDKNNYILEGNNSKRSVPWVNQYLQFMSMHNLKQLIRSPTRVAKSSSTLLDHILTNSDEMITKSGVLNIGLSDHQLIFCTRKKQKSKLHEHKILKIDISRIIQQKAFVTYSKKLIFQTI